MVEWLSTEPQAKQQLVTDMSWAIFDLLKRHKDSYHFLPDEFRWTGAVALGQPFIMQDVYQEVRQKMQTTDLFHLPVFDTVTMGDEAGLHGTFIDAKQRAEQY